MTHDYKRNGTTDLFAALNVATGEVIYDTKPRHSAKEVLGFFKLIDLHVPRHLDVHVVLDNLSAHKAPAVAKWLAHPRRKRWHLHFTPTSSSWLNLVEGWFKQLTDRRLRRGTFTSVDALIEAIEVWAERWNDDPKPFVWRKTADDIITKGPPRPNRPHPPNQIRDAPLGAPRRLVGGLDRQDARRRALHGGRPPFEGRLVEQVEQFEPSGDGLYGTGLASFRQDDGTDLRCAFDRACAFES